MSVVIETTLGDITVDLFLKQRPRACLNFLKLCKIKYYNYHLFHTVSRGFIAQTGDPTGKRTGGESIFGVLEGPLKRYFEAETNPRIKHTNMGTISFVGNEDNMIGSQFFFTLGSDLSYLDERHCVFGEVVEGMDVVELINEAICDTDDRPYQDIRITHTVVLDDPFSDPERLKVPSRSPSPSAERLQGGRIAPDEEIDETAGKTSDEMNEMLAAREAKARATILEMVGDLPDADMAPPENVLFVCKLNPVTNDDDLEIIFSRFGKIKSCEVIRDRKTGDSLQYAFVEFEQQKSCEEAFFKMDNVLIDDRRIHVDFSQSVSKIKWLGKGRGVRYYHEKENDLSKEQYQKGSVKSSRTGVKKGRRDDRDKSKDFYRNRDDKGPKRDDSKGGPRGNFKDSSREDPRRVDQRDKDRDRRDADRRNTDMRDRRETDVRDRREAEMRREVEMRDRREADMRDRREAEMRDRREADMRDRRNADMRDRRNVDRRDVGRDRRLTDRDARDADRRNPGKDRRETDRDRRDRDREMSRSPPRYKDDKPKYRADSPPPRDRRDLDRSRRDADKDRSWNKDREKSKSPPRHDEKSKKYREDSPPPSRDRRDVDRDRMRDRDMETSPPHKRDGKQERRDDSSPPPPQYKRYYDLQKDKAKDAQEKDSRRQPSPEKKKREVSSSDDEKRSKPKNKAKKSKKKRRDSSSSSSDEKPKKKKKSQK